MTACHYPLHNLKVQLVQHRKALIEKLYQAFLHDAVNGNLTARKLVDFSDADIRTRSGRLSITFRPIIGVQSREDLRLYDLTLDLLEKLEWMLRQEISDRRTPSPIIRILVNLYNALLLVGSQDRLIGDYVDGIESIVNYLEGWVEKDTFNTHQFINDWGLLWKMSILPHMFPHGIPPHVTCISKAIDERIVDRFVRNRRKWSVEMALNSVSAIKDPELTKWIPILVKHYPVSEGYLNSACGFYVCGGTQQDELDLLEETLRLKEQFGLLDRDNVPTET